MLEDLRIPQTQPITTALSTLPKTQFDFIAAQHAQFLANEQRDFSYEKCHTLAVKELKALSILLPQEQDLNTVLVLAAWFHYACFFDDVIESLPVEDVHDTLQHCRELLAMDWSKLVQDTVAPIDEKSVAIHMTQNLLVQLATCLGPRVKAARFSHSIDILWIGFEEEADFFANGHRNPESYLRFRQKTISLDFVFAVLADDLDINCGGIIERDLKALEISVRLVLGFQNDLVGLRKDIEQGKKSNFVLVYRDAIAGGRCDLEPAVQEAVRRHNHEVSRSEILLKILAAGGQAEQRYTRKIFDLISNHHQWMLMAKRYKAVC